MISVCYVTNRPVDCVLGPVTNQYQLLSDSLRAQSLPAGLWELVVIDKANPLPRPELSWCAERTRYVRHRATPWGDAFAPAVPRNDGLAVTRGSTVFGLDDAVSFGPGLLETAYRRALEGQYLVPVYRRPKDHKAGGAPVPVEVAGGILAYPRDLAVELGGHPENFAACYSLEDWAFARRLTRAGVHFVRDPDPALHVVLHRTGPTSRPGLARCCYAVDALTQKHPKANTPWTAEDLDCLTGPQCGFAIGSGHCSLLPGANGPRKCDRPERPPAYAVEIMRGYEARPFGIFSVEQLRPEGA